MKAQKFKLQFFFDGKLLKMKLVFECLKTGLKKMLAQKSEDGLSSSSTEKLNGEVSQVLSNRRKERREKKERRTAIFFIQTKEESLIIIIVLLSEIWIVFFFFSQQTL